MTTAKSEDRWVALVVGQDGQPGADPVEVVAASRFDELETEAGRMRAALRRIADAQSGVWGSIAHEALRGVR